MAEQTARYHGPAGAQPKPVCCSGILDGTFATLRVQQRPIRPEIGSDEGENETRGQGRLGATESKVGLNVVGEKLAGVHGRTSLCERSLYQKREWAWPPKDRD